MTAEEYVVDELKMAKGQYDILEMKYNHLNNAYKEIIDLLCDLADHIEITGDGNYLNFDYSVSERHTPVLYKKYLQFLNNFVQKKEGAD